MSQSFDRPIDAKECEAITGIKAATFLFWAWKDAQSDDEPNLGPPSFKINGRRLWMRDGVLRWLDEQQKKSPGFTPGKTRAEKPRVYPRENAQRGEAHAQRGEERGEEIDAGP